MLMDQNEQLIRGASETGSGTHRAAFLDALWLENLAENTLNAYRRDLLSMVEAASPRVDAGDGAK